MKQLLEVIAKNLVQNPSEVYVTETVKNDSIVLELRVAEEDMGKIIGKQGKIAKAIRTVIKSVAIHNNQKVIVEIVQ